MPTLKGVWIQEGSLLGWLYALGTSVWRFFGMVAVVRGVQAPFFNAILSLPFNCGFSLKVFMSIQLQIKVFWATTAIAALLLCLGILYNPCQVHHRFLSNPINSTGIIVPFTLISSSTFFLQVHQLHSWHFWGGVVALEFLKREETGRPWLWGIISHPSPWTAGKLHGIFHRLKIYCTI